MRVSPELLAALLTNSFLAGIILALSNGALRAVTALIDGKSFLKKSRLEASVFEFYEALSKKYRICFRKTKRKGSKSLARLRACYTFTVDFLLFILAGAIVILLCYYLNYGEFRGFCVLGMLVGFLTCHITLGKLIRCLFGELMLMIRYLIFLIFAVILAPLTIFVKICKKLSVFLYAKINNTLEKRKKVLYNNNESLHIYTISKRGFCFLDENALKYDDLIKQKEQKNETGVGSK